MIAGLSNFVIVITNLLSITYFVTCFAVSAASEKHWIGVEEKDSGRLHEKLEEPHEHHDPVVRHLMPIQEALIYSKTAVFEARSKEKFSGITVRGVVMALVIAVVILVLVFGSPILIGNYPLLMDVFFEVDTHIAFPYMIMQCYFLLSNIFAFVMLVNPHPRVSMRLLLVKLVSVSLKLFSHAYAQCSILLIPCTVFSMILCLLCASFSLCLSPFCSFSPGRVKTHQARCYAMPPLIRITSPRSPLWSQLSQSSFK